MDLKNNIICELCYMAGHFDDECLMCKRCNTWGHQTFNCLICKRCGVEGNHKEKDCPCFCQECQKYSSFHSTKNCPKKRIICQKCGSKEHKTYNCQICNKCGIEGKHQQNNCPFYCQKCKKFVAWHTTKNCPNYKILLSVFGPKKTKRWIRKKRRK